MISLARRLWIIILVQSILQKSVFDRLISDLIGSTNCLGLRESIETPKVIALQWKMPFEHNCWLKLRDHFKSFQDFRRK